METNERHFTHTTVCAYGSHENYHVLGGVFGQQYDQTIYLVTFVARIELYVTVDVASTTNERRVALSGFATNSQWRFPMYTAGSNVLWPLTLCNKLDSEENMALFFYSYDLSQTQSESGVFTIQYNSIWLMLVDELLICMYQLYWPIWLENTKIKTTSKWVIYLSCNALNVATVYCLQLITL